MTLRQAFVAIMVGQLCQIQVQHSVAQELGLLEIGDFIHPKELEVPGDSNVHQGLYLSRVYGGYDRNHQYRNEFTDGSALFLSTLHNLYYQAIGTQLQTSLGLTGFLHGSEEAIPDYSGRVQQGFYFPFVSKDYGDQAVRLMVSWYFQKQAHTAIRNQFSISSDVGVPLFTQFYAVGGVLYAWKESEKRHYLSASGRVPLVRGKNGSNVTLGVGWAVEGDEILEAITKLQSLTANVEIRVEVGILPRTRLLDLVYLLSRRFQDNPSYHHQVGLFLDFPLLLQVF